MLEVAEKVILPNQEQFAYKMVDCEWQITGLFSPPKGNLYNRDLRERDEFQMCPMSEKYNKTLKMASSCTPYDKRRRS